MAFKDKNVSRKHSNSNDKYYNCHKLGQFRRDYALSDRRLNRNTQQFRKEESRKRDSPKGYRGGRSNLKTILNRAHQVSENNKVKSKDNSDLNLFVPSLVMITFIVKKQK